MRVYAGMFLYPWDLADEGTEAVTARLRDVGINTAVVAGSYHAGKFLRPHAPATRVIFPVDGTVYFRPTTARYRDTPLRPIVNPLVERYDAFAALADHRAASGVDVAAWMVLLHNTPLGTAHPECVARNAYGDPYWYSLCPSHGSVRAYARALIADVAASYPVQHVVIEAPGFLPYAHGFHHENRMDPPDPWSAMLLALCFCPACAARAAETGLDAARLAETVRDALDAFFDAPSMPRPSDGQALHWVLANVLHDREFASYLAVRVDTVTSLVADLRAATPAGVRLSVIPSVGQPLARAPLNGSDLTRLAGHVDTIEILGYRADPIEVGADAWWARHRIGPSTRLHVVLKPAYPDAADATNLAAKVRVLREVGVDGLSFYNYGHIRRGHLAWIKRALEGRG
ncbi:MAG TPA: hypothetical protein VKZ50_04770 [bacterium]|nr:hypothetical protein [bacterium]